MKSPSQTCQLALVIPAYKAAFLSRTLESIRRQTDLRFVVYVGDDSSPEDLETIVAPFQLDIDIKYHKFGENLGGSNLTRQWDRCIRLSSEPWICLLSDDDTISPNFVSAFYEAKSKNNAHLFRVDTKIINNFDEVIWLSPPLPYLEKNFEHLYHRLCSQRHGCISNLIFSRDRYTRINGFLNLPLAWYADDIFTYSIAGDLPMVTCPNSTVFYRADSGANISAKSLKNIQKKSEALLIFVDWLKRAEPFKGGDIPQKAVLNAMRTWISDGIRHTGLLSPVCLVQFSTLCHQITGDGRFKILLKITSLNLVGLFKMLMLKFRNTFSIAHIKK